MPRPLIGRVGRSAGAAEHRVAKHRLVRSLSRTTGFTQASALICIVALAIAGAPTAAVAQTSAESLARTRDAIDATANQWFAAQRESASLDIEVESLDRNIAQTEHEVGRYRSIANQRVVQLYETGTQDLTGMIGGDPLDVGRRAELIGQANANGQVAIDQFESSLSNLGARRRELAGIQKQQSQTLHKLASQRQTLDNELESLELRSARSAARTELAASIRRADETVTTATAPTRPAVVEQATPPTPTPTTTPPTTPTTVATSTPVVTGLTAPPDTGAVSPHHDEPFLVCTRARESDGDYAAVSSDGYYGAYQFAPTTWNVTAAHLGRLDLVGVLPSEASPYDQDEMAWSLYEWQGTTPWGGRC